MSKTTKDSGKLKTWQDVDKAYKQYAQKDANVRYITSILRCERDQREELGAAITAFVKDHAADLGPGKKKLLESGQIGLTKGSGVKYTKSEADTLEYVIKNRLENCYKVEETLIVSGLKALGPDVLAAAGVEIVTEEKVSLKPNHQAPAVYVSFS